MFESAPTPWAVLGDCGFVSDFSRALIVLPVIESARRLLSLHRATALARKLSCGPRRTEEGRRRLRRAIGAVDRRCPGGANCLRRSLLEIVLDPGAAREPLHAGLQSGGGRGSGHAWLASHPAPATGYDAIITV